VILGEGSDLEPTIALARKVRVDSGFEPSLREPEAVGAVWRALSRLAASGRRDESTAA
jgi:hypothetical protein